MQENSLRAARRLQGNPLESHLRTFVTSLLEDGYPDATVHDKLSLLDRFGQWLRSTEPRCGRASPRQVRPCCRTDMSLAQRDEGLPACLSPRRSHGPSSPRRGPLCDRALAGARVREVHSDVLWAADGYVEWLR